MLLRDRYYYQTKQSKKEHWKLSSGSAIGECGTVTGGVGDTDKIMRVFYVNLTSDE